jgi:DNA-binding beta-propeller fold protein YncE
MTLPHALLRAGYPFVKTLGMRRSTYFPSDLAIGEDRLYVMTRTELGSGGHVRMVSFDDDDLGALAEHGLTWPAGLILDGDGNLFISDEGTHEIIVFNVESGEELRRWGERGSELGQLDRPSLMALDPDGNLLVAEGRNHRIQRFTRDGEPLGAFGSFGAEPGQFNMPWGVAADADGAIYVGDWRNDRIQKLSPEGEPLLVIGQSGSGEGQLNRPAGVAVDQHGDISVADRDNNRVLLFDKSGRYVERFLGDATLGKMGRAYVMANQKVLRLREMTVLEEQKRLRRPTSVRIEGNRLYIADTGRMRVQVYEKEAYPLAEGDIMIAPGAPTLTTA